MDQPTAALQESCGSDQGDLEETHLDAYDLVDIAKEQAVNLPPNDLDWCTGTRTLQYFKTACQSQSSFLFFPSVHGDIEQYDRGLYTNYEKRDVIASLELFLDRLIGRCKITLPEKETYISELTTRFYYPGKLLLRKHYKELLEFAGTIEKKCMKGYGHFQRLLDSFHPDEAKSRKAIYLLLSITCHHCCKITLAMSTKKTFPSYIEELQEEQETFESCVNGGSGHMYSVEGMNHFCTLQDGVLASYRESVEWRWLEGRGVLELTDTPPECLPEISPLWSMVWHMSFTIHHLYGFYMWADDEVKEDQRKREAASSLNL